MRKYPTPWQYLVDIVAQGRLKAAYASNNPKVRAEADKNFRGLTEDEVVFEALAPRKDGKQAYSLTCKVRGFKLNELTFATGSLGKMIAQNANLMAQHEDLATSQITGFYFCEDADQLHLLVHPNSNIHEALKMTGYEFQPEHYKSELYAHRDDILQADGVVSINHPVVAGQIYISYVQALKNTNADKDAAGVEAFKAASEFVEPPVVDNSQAGPVDYVTPFEFSKDATALAEGAADKTVAVQDAAKVDEAPAQETAPAEEAPAEEPVVQIQKKKK